MPGDQSDEGQVDQAREGIVLQPGGGERVPRGLRFHRILAELPELEVLEAIRA
jgi:hypothetical protein